MARTIADIKDEMTRTFIALDSVRMLYKLDVKKTFEDQFSKASIESILFYVFAACAWVLERLFDVHKAEVEEIVSQLKPHTRLWYVNKVKGYMHGCSLPKLGGLVVSDVYDTTGMTPSEIKKARIIRFAVATESSNGTIIFKVAKDDGNGLPGTLSASEFEGLYFYLSQIKDAGVEIKLLNELADKMRIEITLYYDPMLFKLTKDAQGNITFSSLSDGSFPVQDTIRSVISELPFNGEYRNSDLLERIQRINGIEVVDIDSVQTCANGSDIYKKVVGFERPYSGYYSIDKMTLHCYPYSDETVL